MNFRRRNRSHAPAVQMASLMDVVFLLLCFFVTSSVFSQWETEVAIALPTAKSATVPGRMPGEIILNLDSKGNVSVNGQSLTLPEVTERLPRGQDGRLREADGPDRRLSCGRRVEFLAGHPG